MQSSLVEEPQVVEISDDSRPPSINESIMQYAEIDDNACVQFDDDSSVQM